MAENGVQQALWKKMPAINQLHWENELEDNYELTRGERSILIQVSPKLESSIPDVLKAK